MKPTPEQVVEFVRVCREHVKRTGTKTRLGMLTMPDTPFYEFHSDSGDAELSFTALAAITDEYEALWRLERTARYDRRRLGAALAKLDETRAARAKGKG